MPGLKPCFCLDQDNQVGRALVHTISLPPKQPQVPCIMLALSCLAHAAAGERMIEASGSTAEHVNNECSSSSSLLQPDRDDLLPICSPGAPAPFGRLFGLQPCSPQAIQKPFQHSTSGLQKEDMEDLATAHMEVSILFAVSSWGHEQQGDCAV